MVTWNLEYEKDVPIINYCTENNKGIFIKKALDSGNAVLSAEAGSIRKSFDMIFNKTFGCEKNAQRLISQSIPK